MNEKNNSNNILIVNPKQRLGNLMFIFASGLGLSMKFNGTLKISKHFLKRGSYFNNPSNF